MENIWQERIDKVLADPEAAKVAAMLYFIVNHHLFDGLCFHKRQCPEQTLWNEAHGYVAHAKKAAEVAQ